MTTHFDKQQGVAGQFKTAVDVNLTIVYLTGVSLKSANR